MQPTTIIKELNEKALIDLSNELEDDIFDILIKLNCRTDELKEVSEKLINIYACAFRCGVLSQSALIEKER